MPGLAPSFKIRALGVFSTIQPLRRLPRYADAPANHDRFQLLNFICTFDHGYFYVPLVSAIVFLIFKAKRKNQLPSKRYLAIKVLAVLLGFVSLLVSAFHLHLFMTSNPNKGYANGIVFYSLLMISPPLLSMRPDFPLYQDT